MTRPPSSLSNKPKTLIVPPEIASKKRQTRPTHKRSVSDQIAPSFKHKSLLHKYLCPQKEQPSKSPNKYNQSSYKKLPCAHIELIKDERSDPLSFRVSPSKLALSRPKITSFDKLRQVTSHKTISPAKVITQNAQTV